MHPWPSRNDNKEAQPPRYALWLLSSFASRRFPTALGSSAITRKGKGNERVAVG